MIVRDWNNTLQSHIDKFTTAVGKVKERDVLLLQNQKKITELARQTQMLKNAHGEIGSNLDAIFKLQEDQHRSLDELETRLDELERRHGGSAAASSSSSSSHQHNLSLSVYSEHSMDDSERRGAYELAEHINAQLGAVGDSLKDIVERLNRSFDAENADTALSSGVGADLINSTASSSSSSARAAVLKIPTASLELVVVGEIYCFPFRRSGARYN